MTDILGPGSVAAVNAVTTRKTDGRSFLTADTWFKPCTNAAAADGTQLASDFFNGLLAQLRAAIRGNGKKNDGVTPVIAEDNTNDAMLLGAIQALIQRGQTTFGIDTGTADALVISPAPAVTEYKAGARFVVLKNPLVGGNATTTPTIAVSGLAPVTIVKADASALAGGDLKKAVAFEILLDGSYARLVSLLTLSDLIQTIQANAIVPATAAVTLYVDLASSPTPGNDTTGNGTSAAPFATVNRAVQFAAQRNSFATFGLVIVLKSAGVYSGVVSVAGVPNVTIQGATAAPASYVLSASPGAGVSVVSANYGVNLTLSNLTVRNGGSASYHCSAPSASVINLTNVYFESATQSSAPMLNAPSGTINIGGGCSIGDTNLTVVSSSALSASISGTINITQPVGLVGTPAFSASFASATSNGVIQANSGTYFSGSATGTRYYANYGGRILTGGGGANFFPGNAAGSTDGVSTYA